MCKIGLRMNSMRLFYFLMLLGIALKANTQTIQLLTSDNKTSLRGLSVVNNQVIWASGNNGTIKKSVDGGNTWQSLLVSGFEKRDFRDIEAFDSNTAIIMAVTEPAILLKTRDGGKSWITVFEDTTKGMFLDAMDFADEKTGVVVGDPIHNKLFMAMTFDNGDTWFDPMKGDTSKLPTLYAQEALFASSGTNIRIKRNENQELMGGFVTGGTRSRFFTKTSIYDLPMIQGKESTGANSIAFNAADNIVIVGGDFKNDKDTSGNCVLSEDYGKTWHSPQTPPHGYRSCVTYSTEKQLIACGTSGVDISDDGGIHWKLVSTESYHVVQKARNGTAIFLAGSDGRIAKINLIDNLPF